MLEGVYSERTVLQARDLVRLWISVVGVELRRESVLDKPNAPPREGQPEAPTWTPIKPITTQFAVGRTRSVLVVRKQFPLRPAAAKTIHRSQGDTESRIVVKLETRRAIPHIHYAGLSRVTKINGLFITDLCEDEIAVSNDVQTEMQ